MHVQDNFVEVHASFALINVSNTLIHQAQVEQLTLITCPIQLQKDGSFECWSVIPQYSLRHPKIRPTKCNVITVLD